MKSLLIILILSFTVLSYAEEQEKQVDNLRNKMTIALDELDYQYRHMTELMNEGKSKLDDNYNKCRKAILDNIDMIDKWRKDIDLPLLSVFSEGLTKEDLEISKNIYKAICAAKRFNDTKIELALEDVVIIVKVCRHDYEDKSIPFVNYVDKRISEKWANINWLEYYEKVK